MAEPVKMKMPKQILFNFILVFVIVGLIYLYFSKPVSKNVYLSYPYISKYLYLEIGANKTECIPKSLITLESKLVSPEENPIIIGNKSLLNFLPKEKEVCVYNGGNETAMLFFLSREWEDIFTNCRVWQAVDIGHNNTIYYCIQEKEANETLYVKCDYSCSRYFKGDQKTMCAIACLDSIFPYFGQKA
jgi:hypothetical protein